MIFAHIYRSFSKLKPPRCYYKVLNVPTYCSVTDIRVAYLDLAKKFHPDINKEPEAVARFSEIQRAYQVLSEEATRKQYDEANLIGGQKQKERQPPRTEADLEKEREFFKEKHLRGENNKRKDELNDELNFSFKLFRDHFEHVELKKDDYVLYPGTNEEHYEHKDQPPQPFLEKYTFVIVPVAIGLGLWWYVRRQQSKQPDD